MKFVAILLLILTLVPHATLAYFSNSLDLENGSSQYASAGDSTSLSVTGAITLEAWIKLESKPGDGFQYAIISKYNASASDRSYLLSVETTAGTETRLKLYLSQDGGGANIQYKTSSTLLSTGTWYHVAAVWTGSGGSITLYVNGVDAGSTDAAGSITGIENNGSSFAIGASEVSGTPNNYFDGKILNARTWATTRTGTQLTDNYCTALGATTNLQAEHTLDNTYNDNSGNGNTLSQFNSPVFTADVPAICATTSFTPWQMFPF